MLVYFVKFIVFLFILARNIKKISSRSGFVLIYLWQCINQYSILIRTKGDDNRKIYHVAIHRVLKINPDEYLIIMFRIDMFPVKIETDEQQPNFSR